MGNTDRIVHRPEVGSTHTYPLGQEILFGKDNPHAIVYAGMISEDTYALIKVGRGVSTNYSSSYQNLTLFLPVPKEGETQTLDDVLENLARVEVVKLEPRHITLKFAAKGEGSISNFMDS